MIEKLQMCGNRKSASHRLHKQSWRDGERLRILVQIVNNMANTILPPSTKQSKAKVSKLESTTSACPQVAHSVENSQSSLRKEQTQKQATKTLTKSSEIKAFLL